jgi:RimJ/RimL family protein N-acetyltransferase
VREIITDRLILNNFTPADAENLYGLIADYRASPTYKFDHKWPESPAEYGDIAKWFSSGDDYLAVRLQSDGSLIGFVNLTREGDGHTFNLGFIFDSRYHRQGYAFESCQAYLDYARSMGENVSFITGTAKENQPANRLLRKLGFTVVKECSGSFQVDERNNPIVFQGYEYRRD